MKEAAEDAGRNARLNSLADKASFLCGKAEELVPAMFTYLKHPNDSQNKYSYGIDWEKLFQKCAMERIILNGEKYLSPYKKITAIVDPPRIGLHKQVLKSLRENTEIDRLIYVSCNPDTLQEDVAKLCAEEDLICNIYGAVPFFPLKSTVVDMFPHTAHCEMVLYMERYAYV